jgi:hypothetical protein
MAKIETGSLEQIVRQPKEKGFLKAIGGPQFLAAQLFTIFATVLGVYLAGYVSFQRTLEYDRYQKAQQRLDLLTATQDELKQNIALLQKFNEQVAAFDGSTAYMRKLYVSLPDLYLLVWQAAARSSSAFEMPPHILTDLQSLYRPLGKMLTDAQEHWNPVINSSPNYSQFREQVSAQLKFAETSVLPALDKAIAASEQLVKKYAVADDASR